MHPVLALTVALAGAAALMRWCYREVYRVNAELDGLRANASVGKASVEKASVEPVDRNALPKLKPDPKTGEYRLD